MHYKQWLEDDDEQNEICLNRISQRMIYDNILFKK